MEDVSVKKKDVTRLMRLVRMTDCSNLENSKDLQDEKSSLSSAGELDKTITCMPNVTDELETDNGGNLDMNSTTTPLMVKVVEPVSKGDLKSHNDDLKPTYAKITDLHPLFRVAGVTVLIILCLLFILVLYFATKSNACNDVVCMNATVSYQVAFPDYQNDLEMEVWGNTIEVTLAPGNFSLHKVNYLENGHSGTVFMCTQGPHNYSISCSANGHFNCRSIPEYNTKQSLFVGATNMSTKYYIDINCINKKIGLKWK